MIKLLQLLEHQTNGVSEFANTLKKMFPSVDSDMWNDLTTIINNTSCPLIRFEKLHQTVGGISKTDECIINVTAITNNLSQSLFIILHEVGHQFQYSKHGKNIALSIYLDENVTDSVDRLIEIESTADRFASKQTNRLCQKYGIPTNFELPKYNIDQNKSFLIQYVSGLKHMIKQKKLNNIESINDLIYNMIKTQL